MLRWGRAEPLPLPAPQAATSAAEAWEAVKLVNDWVKHAEVKAAATLTAAGVVGGALWNLVSKDAHVALFYEASAVVCAVFAILSAILCLWALKPRLKGREQPTSSLYFDHIARRHPDGPAGYVGDLRALLASTDTLVEQIGQQVWANAHVAARKYYWAGWGLYALAGSIAGLAGTGLYASLVSIGAVSGR